jgi:hypothetical protein
MKKNERALETLQSDPDIAFEFEEMYVTSQSPEKVTVTMNVSNQDRKSYVPLKVVSGSLKATEASAQLVYDIGGLKQLEKFTSGFYDKAFQDPVIDKFIREHGDHHGQRFASWIAEKMGAGTPWSSERRSRKICPFDAHGHSFDSAFDRSSAHFAAWHSPKRSPDVWGNHFNLSDCRIWMRLHFWALRETGAMENSPLFVDYYCRLIGHFVSVYERQAPPFARQSMRWSADPANIKNYLDNGCTMPDVHVPLAIALESLPVDERIYRGSAHSNKTWPYEL